MLSKLTSGEQFFLALVAVLAITSIAHGAFQAFGRQGARRGEKAASKNEHPPAE